MSFRTPEQQARAQIDHMLADAGWVVQTRQQMNRMAATGVAVCEFPLTTGEVDYMLFAEGRPIGVIEAKAAGSETAATKELWIYDLRTNQHVTLKQNPLMRAELDDFVACYHPQNRHEREETWSEEDPDGRWRRFSYEELMARDKANLDIFWIRDESLEETANLPEPDVLAEEIVDDLESALEQFRAILADLGGG